eukprot:365596-Chlamydomonas_euryale.AAC.24
MHMPSIDTIDTYTTAELPARFHALTRLGESAPGPCTPRWSKRKSKLARLRTVTAKCSVACSLRRTRGSSPVSCAWGPGLPRSCHTCQQLIAPNAELQGMVASAFN